MGAAAPDAGHVEPGAARGSAAAWRARVRLPLLPQAEGKPGSRDLRPGRDRSGDARAPRDPPHSADAAMTASPEIGRENTLVLAQLGRRAFHGDAAALHHVRIVG